MTTAIVSSAIANKPLNGGNAWVILSWLRGLQRLGLHVYFVEQIKRRNCVDAEGNPTNPDNSINLAYFDRIMQEFGLVDSAALIFENEERTHGLRYADLLDVAAGADLLVNISGHLTLEPIKQQVRKRIYLDLDPAFTQFWHASGNLGAHLQGHDYYFTIGENVGTAGCPIPLGDVSWRRVRQPVVLEDWPVPAPNDSRGFTTIASWRGAYGPVSYGGHTFGLKVHEFRKFVELPERVPQSFELALDIHPADGKDIKMLRRHGWRLMDPRIVAPDPAAFRSYVQSSGAEFSAAQGIYVETASGWFGDRTVRYLASGKPALVQDTGFSQNYPVGEGLLSYRTLEEAIQGVASIAGEYERHCRAARALAEEFFDSDKVLGRLLQEIDLGRVGWRRAD